MTAHVYAFVCGRHTVPGFHILEDREEEITIPIVGFVVEHRAGLFVFDTGFSSRVHEDLAAYYPNDALTTRRFHFTPADSLAAQMSALGLDPSAVRLLSNSHLHYDHSGGNASFPGATVIMQRAEWEFAGAAPTESTGYRPSDFVTGQAQLLVDGEHDVFGDGSVVLFPTGGHTRGHQSLRVECPDGTAVLAGDACYMAETLHGGRLPGRRNLAFPEEYLRSLARLQELDASGSVVFVGHDPDFWAAQPLAPEPLLG